MILSTHLFYLLNLSTTPQLLPPQLFLIAKVQQFFKNFTILSFTMALGAHMYPYSYMYCAPHRDRVLQGEVGDAGWREVGQGLSTSSELRRIDGDELSSLDELSGVGNSPNVNDEAGRVESVSITSVMEVRGEANGKIVSTNLT